MHFWLHAFATLSAWLFTQHTFSRNVYLFIGFHALQTGRVKEEGKYYMENSILRVKHIHRHNQQCDYHEIEDQVFWYF